MMDRAASMTDWDGRAKGFGYIMLGVLCGSESGIVTDKAADDGAR